MRLKITRPLTGSIDGVQLSRFTPGEFYSVGTTVGSYLLAVGAAEPDREEGSGGSVVSDFPSAEQRLVRRWTAPELPAATAADRPPRKR